MGLTFIIETEVNESAKSPTVELEIEIDEVVSSPTLTVCAVETIEISILGKVSAPVTQVDVVIELDPSLT